MNINKKDEFLISGNTPFCIDVPYKLIETGQKNTAKPLIVYLHGFNDNIEGFRSRCSQIVRKFEAYHLFIRGPYPLYEKRSAKKAKDWGASWYLYDGDQKQFLSSLEKTSGFLDHVIDELKNSVDYKRLCLIGYSMGGYLAGYYAMTRTKSVHDLIVAGARIKTEILNEDWELISHLNILALHGKRDKLVDYKPQRSEIKKMVDHGIHADFKLIDQKHIFNDDFISLICDWLQKSLIHKYNHVD
ncbi:MAG: alpha/beta hydrolase [Balneolaceae bacterium]|nr:alpha/beta hydrolase [Balneolaceae bacterium]